jgi:arylsulfatase A-like enzyme
MVTALALGTGCAADPGASDGIAPPNVVVIFLDDVGYGDFGVYGHPTIRTPHVDALAAEGVKLTGFYAASPACSPSRVALLTGRYPVRAAIHWALGPDEDRGIAAEEWTLAEALGDRGYATAAIGKWHLGARPEFFPTEHGFDSFFGLLYSNDMIRPWVETDRPLELYRDAEPIEHPVDQATLTLRFTREAVRFIEESAAAGRPFFLYLAHSMAHVPLARSAAFEGRSRGGAYGDVIEELDWSVGEIRRALDEAGVLDRTLIILASDNGPWSEMPERMFRGGTIRPWDAGTAGPLRGAKATTWEGGLRVPGIVRGPAWLPGGQVTSELVTAMDVFPTIAALVGIEPDPSRPFDGRDVLPLLRGESASPNELFFYVYPDVVRAVRDARWKLHLQSPDPGAPIRAELYDLVSDPYERFDVAEDHPDVVARLRSAIATFAAEAGARMEGSG